MQIKVQLQPYKYKECALGSLNSDKSTLPSLVCFLQGIIFDYSLGEAVGDVLQELLGFDPNFSFFHVTFTTSIHRQNLHHLHQVGGPDPLSPSNLPVANSQSLDLAAADASDAPVPRWGGEIISILFTMHKIIHEDHVGDESNVSGLCEMVFSALTVFASFTQGASLPMGVPS